MTQRNLFGIRIGLETHVSAVTASVHFHRVISSESYSIFTPASVMTRRHLVSSLFSSASNAAGPGLIVAPPFAAMRSLTSADSSTLTISALSRATIGWGVPLG